MHFSFCVLSVYKHIDNALTNLDSPFLSVKDEIEVMPSSIIIDCESIDPKYCKFCAAMEKKVADTCGALEKKVVAMYIYMHANMDMVRRR